MYCAKCGVQNSDGSTHCNNCGSILMDVVEPVAGQVQPAVMQTAPKTCGLAIAAFVMGLLSMTCILWPILVLPAIICGIVALVKISKNKPCLKGTSLAVTGIVIPAVMILLIPVISIPMAIMLPALSKARTSARRVVCAANIKAMSAAMSVYMDDYDDRYPTSDVWCDLLVQETGELLDGLQCPEDPEGSFSYAINKNLYEIEPGKVPPQMVMLFEANLGRNGVGGPEDLILRHNEHGQLGCNIAFVDGHTEFVTQDQVAKLRWTVE